MDFPEKEFLIIEIKKPSDCPDATAGAISDDVENVTENVIEGAGMVENKALMDAREKFLVAFDEWVLALERTPQSPSLKFLEQIARARVGALFDAYVPPHIELSPDYASEIVQQVNSTRRPCLFCARLCAKFTGQTVSGDTVIHSRKGMPNRNSLNHLIFEG